MKTPVAEIGGRGGGRWPKCQAANGTDNTGADLIATLGRGLDSLLESLPRVAINTSRRRRLSHAFFDAVVVRGLDTSIGWRANADGAAPPDVLPAAA